MVDLLTEGVLDATVATRLLEEVGLEAGRLFGRSGRAALLERLHRYNEAASYSPWLVIVDLEATPPCVADFVAQHLPNPNEHMRFRVAVHSIESWLMGDRDTLARFMRVSRDRFPHSPDELQHPKRHLINIARHSTLRRIARGIIPRQGSGASQGPLYTSLMQDFVKTHWRPEVASLASPSLHRCLNALQTLGD